MNKFFTVAGVALIAFSSQTASSQEIDLNAAAAYGALMATPHGALPAVASPLMAGEGRTAASLDVRYGRYSFETVNADLSVSERNVGTIGLGGNFAVGERGRMGVMLGRSTTEDVDGSLMMAGVDYSVNLLSRAVGTSTTSSLNVGLHPAFGYGKPSEGDVNSMSLAVDLPVSYAMGTKTGMQFVSFLAPGLGYGRVSDGDASLSGTRTTFGGGVALLNIGNGLGLNLGFRKVFLDEAPTQWGLGMSWSR